MDNVLFLHHFESMWEDSLKKFDTNMDDITTKVIDFLSVNDDIDTVLITRMENNQPEDEHYRLMTFCDEKGIDVRFQEYAYAMYRDPNDHDEDEEENAYQTYPMEKFNKTWTYGTRDHHDYETDVLDIEEFHYELKNANKVYLAGAFEGECVLDQEAIFDAIDCEYEKIDGLVVGTYVDYEFQYTPILQEKLNEQFNEIRNRLDADDFEDSLESEIDEVESVLNDACEFFEDNLSDLLLINFEINCDYDALDEMLEAAKYEEHESFRDEKLEFIESAKLLNEKKVDIDDYFYQAGKLSGSKDLGLSKTFNLENSSTMIYLSKSESQEELESTQLIYNETEIPLVFRAHIEGHGYKTNLDETEKSEIIYDFDENFSFIDLHDACRILEEEGFDVLSKIENNQETLILFDSESDCIDEIEVKAKINNEWTEYLSFNELKETLKNIDVKKTKRKKLRI